MNSSQADDSKWMFRDEHEKNVQKLMQPTWIICFKQECIGKGVRKFNVNTEVRKAYMECLSEPKKDLVDVMLSAKEAMKAVVAEKMHLFGSAGKA